MVVVHVAAQVQRFHRDQPAARVVAGLAAWLELKFMLYWNAPRRCNDPTVAGEWECVGNFTDPVTNVTMDRSWDNQFPNFDNTGKPAAGGNMRHRGRRNPQVYLLPLR